MMLARSSSSALSRLSLIQRQYVYPTIGSSTRFLTAEAGKAPKSPPTSSKLFSSSRNVLIVRGSGRIEFSNGDVYEGSFLNGRRHGPGNLKCVDGTTLQGTFTDGRIELGTGTVAFPNGDVYTGDWRNGKKNGKGRLVKADGSVVEGLFKEGTLASETTTAPRVAPAAATKVSQKSTADKKQPKVATTAAKATKPAVAAGVKKSAVSAEVPSVAAPVVAVERSNHHAQPNKRKSSGTNARIEAVQQPPRALAVPSATGAATGSAVPDDDASADKIPWLDRIWNAGTYDGDRVDGKRHGQGTYVKDASTFTYSGEWMNDRPWGHGRVVYATGKMYVGGWQDGVYHGKGLLTAPSRRQPRRATPNQAEPELQDVTEGNFVNGLLEGQGRKVTPSYTYVGEFKSGTIFGQGVLTCQSGEVVTGEFFFGKMYNCTGSYRTNKHTVYVGKWVDGVFYGEKKYSPRPKIGLVPAGTQTMSNFPIGSLEKSAEL